MNAFTPARRAACYVIWLLLTLQDSARADVGVPMVFVTMPMMAVALIPIVLVEALVLSRCTPAAVRRVLWPVTGANLVSTFAGIPLTWFVLVLLQMFTGGGSAYGIETTREKFMAVIWQAPWLIPYDSDLYWMVPTATLVLLVPFFFASWLTEYWVARRLLPGLAPPQVKRGMLLANLASYALLALWVLGQLIVALRGKIG